MQPKEITPLVWGLALVLTSQDDGFVLYCIIIGVCVNFISSVRTQALSRHNCISRRLRLCHRTWRPLATCGHEALGIWLEGRSKGRLLLRLN